MKIVEILILHPLLIFGLSIVLAAIWSKTLFFSIPIFVVGLHFYYPSSTALQIACGILWILLVVGNVGVVAYSSMFNRVPKTLKLLTVLLGVSAAGTFLFIGYFNTRTEPLREYIWGSLGIGVMVGALAYHIILYVICPLIILEKEAITTSVLDYYKSYGRNNSGNCIRFKDDPEGYSISIFSFQKFRRRVGAPASYIKCRCPFGLSFICKIQIDTEYNGKLSTWETSSHTKTQRKIIMAVLVFVIVSVVFFITVFGIAGLLPWQN